MTRDVFEMLLFLAGIEIARTGFVVTVDLPAMGAGANPIAPAGLPSRSP